jgi:hypothetical protein
MNLANDKMNGCHLWVRLDTATVLLDPALYLIQLRRALAVGPVLDDAPPAPPAL